MASAAVRLVCSLLPILFLCYKSQAAALNPSDCLQNPSISPASASPQVQDLLLQCCGTKDGIPRDCCGLIFPHIPASQRCCSCYSNSSSSIASGGSSSAYAESFAPLLNTADGDGCHPKTKNVAAPTQRLLNTCCYVNYKLGLEIGLDCLALAFPDVPKDNRCGQCTSPGTVEDLLYECCAAEDEIKGERDCCSLLKPFRSKSNRNFCPCPRPNLLPSSSSSSAVKIPAVPQILPGSSLESLDGAPPRLYGEKECDPQTQNISPATQKLINKCCLTAQNKGHEFQKKLDCLALAFPNVPWQNRCGQCNSELPAQDLLHECCSTKDGLRRNCCMLVFPKLNETERFCPCSSHGEHFRYPESLSPSSSSSSQQQQQHGHHHRGTQGSNTNHNNHKGHRHHAFASSNLNGNSGNFVGNPPIFGFNLERIKTAESAINLHTYCCNTEGKSTYGFNCEKLVLGVEPMIGNGNRPCGAWTNTLEPHSPTVDANIDYTDYDYKK